MATSKPSKPIPKGAKLPDWTKAAGLKKPKPKTFTPNDYLSGSKTVGQKYNAWNTYGQGKPDFGKGAGPGEPYHIVQKANVGKNISLPGTINWAGNNANTWQRPTAGTVKNASPYVAAIRRRLGWT